MADAKTVERAITTDVQGLSALLAALPNIESEISNFVGLVSEMQGRLIVTGVGKSGHIAAKLAATFTSTGTPAFFLHPTEASHGDLGIVQPTDVILALSWSGETKELSDVIGYAKRKSVPLVAMTGGKDSSLAEASTITLELPPVREACPHNLAPTTSTLLQLALGDGLAIALLESKGFDAESFHGFHPGGSLGSALKKVREIMHPVKTLPLVQSDASVFEAVNALSEKGFGIVGVVQDSKLVGVVTDGDVRRYLAENAEATMKSALHDTLCDKLMTKGSITLDQDTIVGEALSILQSKRISAAFVTENDEPIGLITMLRLLNRGAA